MWLGAAPLYRKRHKQLSNWAAIEMHGQNKGTTVIISPMKKADPFWELKFNY